jgi:hypothetical protein
LVKLSELPDFGLMNQSFFCFLQIYSKALWLNPILFRGPRHRQLYRWSDELASHVSTYRKPHQGGGENWRTHICIFFENTIHVVYSENTKKAFGLTFSGTTFPNA